MFGKKREKKENGKPSWKENHRAFVCTMNGTRELQIENYGSLGDYDEEKIVLHCYQCKMVIEGERLCIEYFTDFRSDKERERQFARVVYEKFCVRNTFVGRIRQ